MSVDKGNHWLGATLKYAACVVFLAHTNNFLPCSFLLSFQPQMVVMIVSVLATPLTPGFNAYQVGLVRAPVLITLGMTLLRCSKSCLESGKKWDRDTCVTEERQSTLSSPMSVLVTEDKRKKQELDCHNICPWIL